jgi:Mn2+/Fe2+ NRAMP family transporter
VVSVPIMAILMILASDPKTMGGLVVGRRLKRLGWLATAVMGMAVAAMLVL